MERTIRCGIHGRRASKSSRQMLTRIQQHFIPSLNAMNPADRRDSLLNSPVPNQLQRAMPMLQAATSSSTGSSSSRSVAHNAPSTQTPSKRPKYRLVLMLPGPPPRYLTINRESKPAGFGPLASILRK
jgi:hypothetical protein